jgi:hypothetical protein
MSNFLKVLVAGAFLVMCGPVHANAITNEDVKIIRAAWEKAHSISSGIDQINKSVLDDNAVNINRRIAVSECLLKLSQQALILEYDLAMVYVTFSTASQMKDRDDEAVAIVAGKASLSNLITRWPMTREWVNLIAEKEKECRGHAAVRDRARVLLDFIPEIDSKVTPIAHRLGAELN